MQRPQDYVEHRRLKSGDAAYLPAAVNIMARAT
jgi:hypothetical protein